MESIAFEKTESGCNASQAVFASFGEIPENAGALNDSSDGLCGALAAAMELAGTGEAREAVKAQFLKLSGGTTCAILKGARCYHCVELARRLAEQQLSRRAPDSKPRLLLLGDSIRMGYQDAVTRELAQEFTVVGPGENCRFAKYLLNELERFFQECGEPDVIHWNAGLWDTAIVCEEDGMFTRPDEYVYYMERIQRELLKHTSKVIFATTTPVGPVTPNQNPEFIKILNEAIVPVFASRGVVINDLYSFVTPYLAEYIGPDNIHLSPVGAQAVACKIADMVRKIAG